MTAGQRSGPGGNPARSTKSPATDRFGSEYPIPPRQDADSLFGVDVGAYGGASYRLEGDPEPSAEERKQTGLVKAWQHASNAWKAKALTAVLELAATGRPFCADDVRARVGYETSDKAWGALLGGCARRGLIRKVGYQTSERPERHGSVVAVWVGV